MSKAVFDKGGDEAWLEFMPEAPDSGLSGVASPIGQLSVLSVPSSSHERLPSAHPVQTPPDRAQIRRRMRRILARCVPGNGVRNTARHPPSRRVSLISAIGGAAVGALAMWLCGVQPRGGQPTAMATDGGATLQARASAPAVGLGLPSASMGSTLPAWGPRPTQYRGAVLFRSEPLGAQVFVNGQPVGSTPLVLNNLSVGSRAVRLEAQGYQSWSAAVRVVANEQTRVTVHLDAESSRQ
jgi:hypothetical protein